MITSEVGKKGTTYEEVSIGADGEVSKKSEIVSYENLADLEVIYNADLNQDNQIGYFNQFLEVN
jgi:hypothetical protein